MKKQTLFKYFLLLASAFLVTSCSQNVVPYTPPSDPSGDPFEPIDLGPGMDISPSEEDLTYQSNQDYNVTPDYKLKVAIKPQATRSSHFALRRRLLDRDHTSNLINVLDNDGAQIDVQATQTVDEGGNEYFLVSPVGGVYGAGAIVKATLTDNNLYFKDRNPDFSDFYFSIPKEETSYFNISSKVPFFDIHDVIYFPVDDAPRPEFDDPESEEAAEWFNNATFHFGYNYPLNLKEGTTFGVSLLRNNKPDLSNANTFYGKYVRSEKEGNGYKITFKNADLTEIFKDDQTGDLAFDYYQVDENPEIRSVRQLTSENEILEAFKNTEEFQRLIEAIYIGTNKAVPKPEILQNFGINLNMKTEDNSFYCTLDISGIVPLGESKMSAIKVAITLQWVISFQASGSVEIKTFLGVPYKINCSGEVTKITDFSFEFKISWMFRWTPEEEDKSIPDRIKDAYKDLEDNPYYFNDDMASVATNNHISKPVCALEIPFGYVFSFQVMLSLELTVDLNVMFRYGYHSHSVEKILAFNNSDGIENTGNTTEASCSSHSIDLGGTIGIEAGVKASISVGIVGLRKLFQIGVSGEFGVAMKIQAMGGMSFGSDQSFNFYGGFSYKVGPYVRVSAYFDLLMVFHWQIDFKNTWYWDDVSIGASVLDLFATDQQFDTREIDINDTNLLTCKIFSTDEMAIRLNTYQTNSTVKYQDAYIKPLTIESLTPGMSVDESRNKIIISDDSPAQFSGQLKVTIHPDLVGITSNVKSRTVNVNFRAKDAKMVYFGETGQNGMAMDVGKKINFKAPIDTKEYDTEYNFDNYGYDNKGAVKFDFKVNLETYDFLCYTVDGEEYDIDDNFIMPSHDVVINIKLKVIIYYYVSFYNGDNELINKYKVREKTASPEPSITERAMEGWVFLGWDRDFSYIIEDISVYGIYAQYTYTEAN